MTIHAHTQTARIVAIDAVERVTVLTITDGDTVEVDGTRITARLYAEESTPTLIHMTVSRLTFTECTLAKGRTKCW